MELRDKYSLRLICLLAVKKCSDVKCVLERKQKSELSKNEDLIVSPFFVFCCCCCFFFIHSHPRKLECKYASFACLVNL